MAAALLSTFTAAFYKKVCNEVQLPKAVRTSGSLQAKAPINVGVVLRHERGPATSCELRIF